MNQNKQWQFTFETMIQTSDYFYWDHYQKQCQNQWTIISAPDYLKKRQGGLQYYLEFLASANQQIVYLVHRQSDLDRFVKWFNNQSVWSQSLTIKNQKIIAKQPFKKRAQTKRWGQQFSRNQPWKSQSVLGYVVSLDEPIAINWDLVTLVWFENPRFLNEQLWINFYQLLRPFFNKKCRFETDQPICQIHLRDQCQVDQDENYYLVMVANDDQFDQNDLLASVDQFVNQPVANQIDQSFINQIINHWQTIQVLKINHDQPPQSTYLKDFSEEFIDQNDK